MKNININRRFIAASLVLIILVLHCISFAQTRKKPDKYFYQGLFNVQNGSQFQSTGSSFMASDENIFIIDWNPAVLSHFNQMQTSLNYGSYEYNVQWGAVALGGQNWGISINKVYNTLLSYDDDSLVKQKEPDIQSGGLARLALSFGITPYLSLGTGLKFLQMDFEKPYLVQDPIEQVKGFSSDIGLYMRLSKLLDVGVVAHDVFHSAQVSQKDIFKQDIKKNLIFRTNLRAGLALNIGKNVRLVGDGENLGFGALYHLGAQIKLPGLPFKLWGGTQGTEAELWEPQKLKYSWGLCVKLWDFDLKYSYMAKDKFDANHAVGLTVRFRSRQKSIINDFDRYIRSLLYESASSHQEKKETATLQLNEISSYSSNKILFYESVIRLSENDKKFQQWAHENEDHLAKWFMDGVVDDDVIIVPTDIAVKNIVPKITIINGKPTLEELKFMLINFGTEAVSKNNIYFQFDIVPSYRGRMKNLYGLTLWPAFNISCALTKLECINALDNCGMNDNFAPGEKYTITLLPPFEIATAAGQLSNQSPVEYNGQLAAGTFKARVMVGVFTNDAFRKIEDIPKRWYNMDFLQNFGNDSNLKNNWAVSEEFYIGPHQQ